VVDIFDEVDEDLRAERVARFARRYAVALLGLVVLVVIAVAAWQAWTWHRAQQNARAGSAFLAVLDSAGRQGSASQRQTIAASFAKVAATSPAGYATLARLNEASLLAESGQRPQADAIWQPLMDNAGINPVLRQVAVMGWASHELDTAEPSLIQARLGPLSADDSPWRPLALQYLALLDLRLGHRAEAITALQSVANDASTPADMRSTASALMQALGAPAPQG
jgi:hypothetical protein